MMTTFKRHLITDGNTWMVNEVAIYLTPADKGWDVNAITMMGETVESETFATEEVARRFVAELVKDLS